MKSNIIVIISLFLLGSVVADFQLLPCTTESTGKCSALGGCNTPSNIDNCEVIWQGKNYPCTSPPIGHIYVGTTCNYMLGCAVCSANSQHSPQPICQWKSVPSVEKSCSYYSQPIPIPNPQPSFQLKDIL